MPNRIIKESICTSPNLNDVSPEAERLFYRLIVNADDYGLYDGRPRIIRAKCFPLLIDKIKDSHVIAWLQELADHGLVEQYTVNSGYYIHITTWEAHQQIRAKRTKYPAPASDINCNQLPAIDTSRTRPCAPAESNPIQSNPNPNPIHIAPQAANDDPKKAFGIANNVFLTDAELSKLNERFGESDALERINRLSTYIGSKGRKYRSHYLTILDWAGRDKVVKTTSAVIPGLTIERGDDAD